MAQHTPSSVLKVMRSALEIHVKPVLLPVDEDYGLQIVGRTLALAATLLDEVALAASRRLLRYSMPNNTNFPPVYTAQPHTQQANTSQRTTFAEYKYNTAISNKRRDTNTKKIDALVEGHLMFPNNANRLHELQVEAPKHLDRLQRSSPMRHALVSSQLNLIVSQAASHGAISRTPAQHAQSARDFSQQPYAPQSRGGSGRHNNVVIVNSGSGSGSGSDGSGSGGGSDGSGGS